MKTIKITCPSCKHTFIPSDELVNQFRQSFRESLETEFFQRENELKQLKDEFTKSSSKFIAERKAFDDMVKREVDSKLKFREQELKTEASLKIKEKEIIIESLKTKIDEARQKINQGSIQIQGEAQELLLEELLTETHPHDLIEEIGKGIRGADCIQTVRTESGIQLGRILYESKRTKSFSSSFIPTLKQNNRAIKAEAMVLVTQTMPKEVEGRFGLVDGVWICKIDAVSELSLMLRYSLLKVHAVMARNTDRKDKMSLLYDYLTSEDFKATFESILDGFKAIRESHQEEQKKTLLLWKKREIHLSQVLTSLVDLYGSVSGISGEIIPEIKTLQFPKAG